MTANHLSTANNESQGSTWQPVGITLWITQTPGKCLFGHSTSSQRPLQKVVLSLPAPVLTLKHSSVWESDLQWTNIKFKIRQKSNLFLNDCRPVSGNRLGAVSSRDITLWPALCWLKWFSWFYTDRNSCGGRRAHAVSSHDASQHRATHSLRALTLLDPSLWTHTETAKTVPHTEGKTRPEEEEGGCRHSFRFQQPFYDTGLVSQLSSSCDLIFGYKNRWRRFDTISVNEVKCAKFNIQAEH